jgi:hypothetical protein
MVSLDITDVLLSYKQTLRCKILNLSFTSLMMTALNWPTGTNIEMLGPHIKHHYCEKILAN